MDKGFKMETVSFGPGKTSETPKALLEVEFNTGQREALGTLNDGEVMILDQALNDTGLSLANLVNLGTTELKAIGDIVRGMAWATFSQNRKGTIDAIKKVAPDLVI